MQNYSNTMDEDTPQTVMDYAADGVTSQVPLN